MWVLMSEYLNACDACAPFFIHCHHKHPSFHIFIVFYIYQTSTNARPQTATAKIDARTRRVRSHAIAMAKKSSRVALEDALWMRWFVMGTMIVVIGVTRNTVVNSLNELIVVRFKYFGFVLVSITMAYLFCSLMQIIVLIK